MKYLCEYCLIEKECKSKYKYIAQACDFMKENNEYKSILWGIKQSAISASGYNSRDTKSGV